jgi:hypothetical protein
MQDLRIITIYILRPSSYAGWPNFYFSSRPCARLYLCSLMCTANFLLSASSAYCLTLKMERVRSSESSVNFYRATRRHVPEYSTLHYFLFCIPHWFWCSFTVNRNCCKFNRTKDKLYEMELHVTSMSLIYENRVPTRTQPSMFCIYF